MMKETTKKVIGVTVTLGVLVALVLTTLVFLNPNNSDKATPESAPSPSVSQQQDDSKNQEKVSDTKSGEQAPRNDLKKAYDDMKLDGLKGVGSFSDEETAKVIKTAVRYSNQTMANTYFNSGAWYKDGKDMNEVYSYLEEFFTPQRNAEIRTIGPDGMLGRDLMPILFFLAPDESQGITGSPACESGDADKCPGDITYSKVDYAEVKDGDRKGMNVKFDATMNLPIQVNDRDATSKITYHYNLTFVKNDQYKHNESFMNEYVIDTYQTTIDFGQAEVK